MTFSVLYPVAAALLIVPLLNASTPLNLLQQGGDAVGNRATIIEASPAELLVNFEAGGYPRVDFPCPAEGLDLSAYRGIEIIATNMGDTPIRGGLRVDNAGDASDQFWNMETALLKPGEAVTIQSVFGQNNGRPAYPLDASEITAYQFFLANPKDAVKVKLSAPMAYGEASDAQRSPRFSKPADRDTKVMPPAWLGEKPPVAGDWELTLDESFNGETLDTSVWATRLAFVGPAREESQRYRDENVAIADGVASLKVEHSPGHQYDDPELPKRDYAAGMLSSYDKWTQRYGYFEIRAKVPTAKGAAVVFGLIPDRGAEGNLSMHERRTSHDFNGKGMEMDVVRQLAEWGPGRVAYSTRWGGPAGTHIQKHWGDSYVYHGATEDGWHVYGMLWEADRLVWFIDGKKTGEWQSDAIADVPCYLSVTMPMGRHGSKQVDTESLPDAWEIDYIRVWQQQ
ncbi:glycoside hydrolase family 16 protein [Cerasicoccus fimbriatus]|uniref:glycoside hydrolase family 16 protein n=1 Tax=Cerasicoccus fimbriatus TaxID=3014554 RepID=UPI0022B47DC6|nr:glycoside hydrolase family 16 protein [Cerasicoccus sp. TK19100]